MHSHVGGEPNMMLVLIRIGLLHGFHWYNFPFDVYLGPGKPQTSVLFSSAKQDITIMHICMHDQV